MNLKKNQKSIQIISAISMKLNLLPTSFDKRCCWWNLGFVLDVCFNLKHGITYDCDITDDHKANLHEIAIQFGVPVSEEPETEVRKLRNLRTLT